MRLLNSETYGLHEFGSLRPKYAILSHTWEEDEVTFQDLTRENGGDGMARSKKGFLKIEGCCRRAMADGFEWVWVDTCCIDKSSSAELSEAINSMYQWYKDAAVCYAYLADVPRLSLSPFLGDHNHILESDSRRDIRATATRERESFRSSRWFSRGWTLQELIAPTYVEFYAADWSEIGTKAALARQIELRTGIEASVLCGKPPSEYSVATRMSWAAGRETTRVEDLAYCLLGLFDVNMPLLYGEGSQAFQRLQLEILRKSEACSLLAWAIPSSSMTIGMSMSGSVLARNPKQFQHLTVREVEDGTVTEGTFNSSILSRWHLDGGLALHYGPASFKVSNDRLAFDPPAITSRGILTMLLLIPFAVGSSAQPSSDDSGSSEDPAPGENPASKEEGLSDTSLWLAWTFCESPDSERSFCILLESSDPSTKSPRKWPNRGANTQTLAVQRALCNIAFSVPSHHIAEFRPRLLYLSTNQSRGSEIVQELTWNPSANCQLKAVYLDASRSSGCAVNLMAAFPQRQIEGGGATGTYILGSPRWDGVAASLVRQEQNAVFISIHSPTNMCFCVILFGLAEPGGNVYCDIHPVQRGASLAVQGPSFGDFVRGLHEKLETDRVDRVVRPCLGFNVCLAAKMVGNLVAPTGRTYNLVLSIQIGWQLDE